jgi:hypothetical protein
MLSFISPPRPKDKIFPGQLPLMEQSGRFLVQPKFDGDRRCIAVKGEEIVGYNRHGKTIRINHELAQEIKSLSLPSGLTYLDGEFLSQNGVFALFDVLYHNKPLVGVGQIRRLDILKEVCHNPQVVANSGLWYVISPHIWMAAEFYENFSALYLSTVALNDIIEGLLLRKKASYLGSVSAVGEYDCDWQVRCRQPAKGRRC